MQVVCMECPVCKSDKLVACKIPMRPDEHLNSFFCPDCSNILILHDDLDKAKRKDSYVSVICRGFPVSSIKHA